MMNNTNTIIGAVIAALIAFLTGLLALLQQEGVQNLSDISTVSLVVLGIGAAITFLKDFQALATRRVINKVTNSGDGGGKIVKEAAKHGGYAHVGLLTVLAAVTVIGCAGTRAAYEKADGAEDVAKVMVAHYTALVREANAAAESGDLTGGALSRAQDVVRAGQEPVDDLNTALSAWQALQSAETEAELDAAIVDAAKAISRLIDILEQSGVTGHVIDEAQQDINPLLLAAA